MAQIDLQRTSLYDSHQKCGARFVDFGGWEMPVSYDSIVTEHAAVREAAGMFDVGHMGRVTIAGPDRLAFLQRLLPTSLDVDEGDVVYSFVCREDGTAIDDITISKFGDTWRLVPNASNREAVLEWMRGVAADFAVTITDRTFETSMIAVQGPKAMDALAKHCAGPINDLTYYTAMDTTFDGELCEVYRGGYTGEDGCEVVVAADKGAMVWEALLAEGVTPCGLGARDTLRLEVCFPLYGHELGGDLTPIEARLGFAVNSDADYIGKAILTRQKSEGAPRRLIAFHIDGRQIARQGAEIYHGDQKVGWVSSGSQSPTLGKPIGLGFVEKALSKVGTEGLEVQIRNRRLPITIVKIPMVPKSVAPRKK